MTRTLERSSACSHWIHCASWRIYFRSVFLFLSLSESRSSTLHTVLMRISSIGSIAYDLKLFQEILHVLRKHGYHPTFSAKSELLLLDVKSLCCQRLNSPPASRASLPRVPFFLFPPVSHTMQPPTCPQPWLQLPKSSTSGSESLTPRILCNWPQGNTSSCFAGNAASPSNQMRKSKAIEKQHNLQIYSVWEKG